METIHVHFESIPYTSILSDEVHITHKVHLQAGRHPKPRSNACSHFVYFVMNSYRSSSFFVNRCRLRAC